MVKRKTIQVLHLQYPGKLYCMHHFDLKDNHFEKKKAGLTIDVNIPCDKHFGLLLNTISPRRHLLSLINTIDHSTSNATNQS